jgi:hypothetical protein
MIIIFKTLMYKSMATGKGVLVLSYATIPLLLIQVLKISLASSISPYLGFVLQQMPEE